MTLGSLLKARWGDRWPDVQECLRGENFAQLVVAPPPCEQVVGSVCAQLHVSERSEYLLRLIYNAPETTDGAWLRAHYVGTSGISESEVSEVGSRLRQALEAGQVAFDRFLSILEAELRRKCARMDYQWSPYREMRLEPKPEDMVVKEYVVLDGWIVTCIVRRAEIPEAEASLAALDRVHETFDRIVQLWAAETGRACHPVSREPQSPR